LAVRVTGLGRAGKQRCSPGGRRPKRIVLTSFGGWNRIGCFKGADTHRKLVWNSWQLEDADAAHTAG
jgi:hypothetical protein